MTRQIIDTGLQINDGTGDSLRVGANKINSNFTEIYENLGDGTNLTFAVNLTPTPNDGQTLLYNALTGEFRAGNPGSKGDKGDKGDTGTSITNLAIDGSGNLIVTLSNSTTINAGNAKGPQGSGDVNGPVSANDNSIALFSGLSGKALKNSLVTIATNGAITAPSVENIIPFKFTSFNTLPNPINYEGALGYTADNKRIFFANGSVWKRLAHDEDVIKQIVNSATVTVTQQSPGVISLTATGSGSQTFNTLTDAVTLNLTIDEIAFPAITKLEMIPNGTLSWLIDGYDGENPTIYAISGTTVAFKILGNSFQLTQSDGTTLFNSGIKHVSPEGTLSSSINAQNKTNGTLYWNIPADLTGTYKYKSSTNPSMIGEIIIKTISSL